ncbi:MAG: VCBS repeat-containing protein [Planctomycetota bacterium]
MTITEKVRGELVDSTDSETMNFPSSMRRFAVALVGIALCAVSLTSCERPKSRSGTPSHPRLEALPSVLTDLEQVEDLSEAVANRLIEFSDAVRRRDYEAASSYLAPTFEGLPFPDGEGVQTQLAVGVTRNDYPPFDDIEPVAAGPFVASLERILQPLEVIERAFFKTRAAEFDTEGKRGLLRMTVQVIGRAAARAPWALNGAAFAEVRLEAGAWKLNAFYLVSLQLQQRPAPLFTEVSVAADVGLLTPRLGTKGNSNFYWRGAIAGDIDGDGDADIFTTTAQRSYLYRNAGDGKFHEVAAVSGLTDLMAITGSLFLDYDNDGDVDLFCASVGWIDDDVPNGSSLRLFRNDGIGRFEDVSLQVGLGSHYSAAFGVCAADVNNDGWLDIFVCNYNRLDAEYPNSWFAATNGKPNALFLNHEGKGFREASEEAGVAGNRWSYAAAFADYDEDGDQDLYVANDYGDNCLYRNRGDGTFEEVATELGVLDTGNGMGVAWGDLDNDGRLDLYVSNMSSSAGKRILSRMAQANGSDVERTLYKLAAGNTIFRQTADHRFERLPADHGGIGASWAWSASILDIDLDGTQDIYVANGFISGDSLKDT